MAADDGRVDALTGASEDVADRVRQHVRSRPPTLGAGRLVCIDGPAGSGKSTLADRLVALDPGSGLVHMDDLYEGWGGLPSVDRQLEALLRPLAAGHDGHYRRWDWPTGSWAERVAVPRTGLLVLEGVGSGSRLVADLVTTLVWVEASYETRLHRGVTRDGEAFAPHWRQWAEAEGAHFTANRTRDRADLLVRTDDPR